MENSIKERKYLYSNSPSTSVSKLSELLFLSPQQLSNRHDQLHLKKLIFRLKVKEMIKRWKKASKKSKNRLLILKQWSATEQSYIKDLEIIVKNIQKPLRQKLLVSHEDEIKVLFPNLMEMITLSSELLKEINIFISKWNPKQTMIGQKLAYFYKFFIIYRDYCKNFQKGQKIIKNLRENNPEAISNIERNLKLDIESYLIKPIQRPPKYELLLREYLKNISQNHFDISHIKNSLQKYHEINEANNQSMEQQMRIDKMIELDVRYGGSIIKSEKGNRYLVEEFDGYTIKKVCKIYLFNDMLFVVEMQKQGQQNEMFKNLSSNSTNCKKGICIEFDGIASWVETSIYGYYYFFNIVFVCGTRQNIHLFFDEQKQKTKFCGAVKTVIRDLYQKESYKKSLINDYKQKTKKFSETISSHIFMKKFHLFQQLLSFLPTQSIEKIYFKKHFNRIQSKAQQTILQNPSDRASSRLFQEDQKFELLYSVKQDIDLKGTDLPNFRIKVIGVAKESQSTVNTDTLYIVKITTPYPYQIFQQVYLWLQELSQLYIHLKKFFHNIKIPDLFQQPQNMEHYSIQKKQIKTIEYKKFFIERFLNFIIRDPQIMLFQQEKIMRSLKVLKELWEFSIFDIQKCECKKCLEMLEPQERLKDADYIQQSSTQNAKETILCFEIPNKNIQTSKNDVFNKEYTYVDQNKEKYRRIAVGTNSNSKCSVHENFNAIVFMDERQVQNADLAFLNRFEKHHLTLNSVLDQDEKDIVYEIEEWINQLLSFKDTKTNLKQQESYLINSSQQSICTLAYKYREKKKEGKNYIMKEIKKELLKNCTEDFLLALKSQKFIEKYFMEEVEGYMTEIKNEEQSNKQNKQQSKSDKIIFTYDDSIYSQNKYRYWTEKTHKIRIRQISSQRHLKKQVNYALQNQKIDNIHILVDFHNEILFINYLAYLVESLKTDYKLKKPNVKKQIIIFIKLSRNSFKNSGRSNINISYILPYEQRCINDLSANGEMIFQKLQKSSFKEMYIDLKIEKDIENIYIDAFKIFKILKNPECIMPGNKLQQVQEFQTKLIFSMCKNKQFKKTLCQFITENLSSEKINPSIILNSREDIMACRNHNEIVEKLIETQVLKLICCFIDRSYRNNLLFGHFLDEMVKFYKNFYQVDIIEYVVDREVYKKFFLQVLNKLVMNQNIPLKVYSKTPGGNLLRFLPLCLLPGSIKDFEFNNPMNQDCLKKKAQQILQLAQNQDEDLIQKSNKLMLECSNTLDSKSLFLGSNTSNELQELLKNNQTLQILYFFDYLSHNQMVYNNAKNLTQNVEEKLLNKNTTTNTLPIEKISVLFVKIFKKLTMKQRIVMLSLNQQFWTSVFNLWNLWIMSYGIPQYKKILHSYYNKDKNQIFEKSNESYELPNLLTEVCKITLSYQEQRLNLSWKSIDECQGISNYLSLFKSTYVYIQKIYLYCSSQDVQYSQNLKATKRFIDLLQSLFKSQKIHDQIKIFLGKKNDRIQSKKQQQAQGQIKQYDGEHNNEQNPFESKVQKYLKSKISQFSDQPKKMQNILSYMGLQIFPAWLSRLNEISHGVFKEKQECINLFVEYCNKYEYISNNCQMFLKKIFTNMNDLNNPFLQDEDGLFSNEKFQYLQNGNDAVIDYLNDKINTQENFAVCIGNQFLETLRFDYDGLKNEFKDEDLTLQQQKILNVEFLKVQKDRFTQLIKQRNNQNQVSKIYQLQFCKLYCLKYLEIVISNQQLQLQIDTSEILKTHSDLSKHLRLFSLKNLVFNVGRIQQVKEKYLGNDKCEWINEFREMFDGKEFDLIVPPSDKKQIKILQLIKKFKDSNYTDTSIFEQIIKGSVQNTTTKYEFFNFMVNEIYTSKCPQSQVIKIKEIVQKNHLYSEKINKVQRQLLIAYCDHHVNHTWNMKKGKGQKSEKQIEQFINQQLVYLNYLNILVACSKKECPLIEIFFDKQGQIQQNYHEWLEQRFLIVGPQNPALSIINGFFERNNMLLTYYRCSSDCDFTYEIDACGKPMQQSQCPYCGKGIGGTEHKVYRVQEGAKGYRFDRQDQKKQFAAIRDQISSRKQFRCPMIKQVRKLKGYGYDRNFDQMIKQTDQNARISMSAKFVLQQMIFTMWSFLSSRKLIKEDEVQKIFSCSNDELEKNCAKVAQQFNKMITQKLSMGDKVNSTIWHLGVTKAIFELISNYKQNITQQQIKFMGLVDSKGRDLFEQKVSKIIVPLSSGNQRQKFINQSRSTEAGVKVSGQNILQEKGGYQQHLSKYPLIRLIKVIDLNKSPSFDNLGREYKEFIKSKNPILNYFIDKQEQIEKLMLFRTIFTFCTKILKTMNFKITRKQAQNSSILKILQNLSSDSSVESYRKSRLGFNQSITSKISNSSINENLQEEIKEFCKAWNTLRQEKFKLEYGCHQLGNMGENTLELNCNSKAINFIPDNRYKGDQKGQMILSLLRVIASKYNIIQKEINQLKMTMEDYRELQIFNKIQICPTQVQENTKIINISLQDIDNIAYNCSNWPVEYGILSPYYCIDKIQNILIDRLIGCNLLSEDLNDYDSINFIGEDLSFITELREFAQKQQKLRKEQIEQTEFTKQQQLNKHHKKQQWQTIPKKNQIERFFINLKETQIDNYLKETVDIKGALEVILMFYRLKMNSVSSEQTLRSFIEVNNLTLKTPLIEENIFFSELQLKHLLTLYEYVELQLLSSEKENLNESYRKDNLTETQMKNLKTFIKELKSDKYEAQDKMLYHFKVALYRFVSRVLSLVGIDENMRIYDYLDNASDLWPNGFDTAYISKHCEHYEKALSVPLTKVGAVLAQVPFEMDKSINEQIEADRKQKKDTRMSQPESLSKTNNKAKPKVRKRTNMV